VADHAVGHPRRAEGGFLIDVSATSPNAHGFRETIPTIDVYFDTHWAFSPSSRVEPVTGVDDLYGAGNARGGDFDYFVNLDGSDPPSGSDLPSEAAIRITDRRDFAGLYGQVRWEPAERWRLEVGLRLNHTAEYRRTKTVDFASGTTVSGQDRRNLWRGSGFAAATWTAWERDLDSLNAYVDYRNTFKPAAVDFGLDSEPEILAPETAESYEAGLKCRLLEGKLAVDLSAFRMDFRNLLVSQSAGGAPVLVNAGAARFSGLELEAAWRLHPNLTWRLGTSLHDARFHDFVTEFAGVPAQLAGNRVEMSPRNMASTGLVLSGARGWQGHLEMSWVGSRFLNKRNTARAPAYTTWEAGVGYRRGAMEIRLDGWNLNDRRPPVAESELGDAQYYLLPARRLEMTLLWTFGC
jgi:iron complex outermembrane receptor protein